MNWITVYELRRGKAPRRLDGFWLDNLHHDREQRELKAWLASGKSIKLVPSTKQEPSRWD